MGGKATNTKDQQDEEQHDDCSPHVAFLLPTKPSSSNLPTPAVRNGPLRRDTDSEFGAFSRTRRGDHKRRDVAAAGVHNLVASTHALCPKLTAAGKMRRL